jgi:hypothetical protein
MTSKQTVRQPPPGADGAPRRAVAVVPRRRHVIT